MPLALLASAAWAQNVDYLPLQTGNQWIYQQSTGLGSSNRTIEVVGTTTAGSQTYYLVSGFAGESAAVRRTDDNKLVKLDPATGQESVLIDFAAAEGSSFPTAIDNCTASGSIASRAAAYKGPIGQFDAALAVDYKPSCADAGLQRDLYLGYVGLVQRTESTIAGPRTFDLIYAMVGGVAQITGPLVSFGIALDQSSYKAGAKATARLTLRNTQSTPIVLEFSSGQEYDVAILNDAGKEVYRWSAARLFAQMLHSVEVSGEKNWVVQITVPADLAAGKYVAQAWLTTSGTPAKKYSASTGFEIAK